MVTELANTNLLNELKFTCHRDRYYESKKHRKMSLVKARGTLQRNTMAVLQEQ